jgi:zinc transporter ZupT
MMIGRRTIFVLLSLGSICAAVGCAYGYLVLAFKVGNTNQDPTVERIAIAWLLGAVAGVCLAIGFAVAAVFSKVKG